MCVNVSTLTAASGKTGTVPAPRELEEFYACAYPRLVATMTLLAGSRAEAEELAQEAFVRLIPRWVTVREYDDPEAWLRTTARRLATSRWRRAVVAARSLPMLAPRPGEAGPGTRGTTDVELDVDLARMLSGLSREHREVLVWHHALGLGVEEIARELGIAPGTVKSRLHRAREAARAAAQATAGNPGR